MENLEKTGLCRRHLKFIKERLKSSQHPYADPIIPFGKLWKQLKEIRVDMEEKNFKETVWKILDIPSKKKCHIKEIEKNFDGAEYQNLVSDGGDRIDYIVAREKIYAVLYFLFASYVFENEGLPEAKRIRNILFPVWEIRGAIRDHYREAVKDETKSSNDKNTLARLDNKRIANENCNFAAHVLSSAGTFPEINNMFLMSQEDCMQLYKDGSIGCFHMPVTGYEG
jgi:hypothetical protein